MFGRLFFSCEPITFMCTQFEFIKIGQHLLCVKNTFLLSYSVFIRLPPNIGFTVHSTGQIGGVHTFGYNFAETEPIWMKSGAL